MSDSNALKTRNVPLKYDEKRHSQLSTRTIHKYALQCIDTCAICTNLRKKPEMSIPERIDATRHFVEFHNRPAALKERTINKNNENKMNISNTSNASDTSAGYVTENDNHKTNKTFVTADPRRKNKSDNEKTENNKFISEHETVYPRTRAKSLSEKSKTKDKNENNDNANKIKIISNEKINPNTNPNLNKNKNDLPNNNPPEFNPGFDLGITVPPPVPIITNKNNLPMENPPEFNTGFDLGIAPPKPVPYLQPPLIPPYPGNHTDTPMETDDEHDGPFVYPNRRKSSAKRLLKSPTNPSPKITKTVNISNNLTKRTYKLQTKNSYEPLSDSNRNAETSSEDEANDDPPQTTARAQISQKARDFAANERKNKNKTTDKQKQNKKIVPPPIILDGVAQSPSAYRNITAELNNIIKNGYTLKFAKKTTIINIFDIDDYNAYYRQLQANPDNSFHTYATAESKTHAFVLRGLDYKPDVEFLKDVLINDHGLPVKMVYLLKTQFRPLYMVVFNGPEIKLSTLNEKIKYITHLSVSWERRHQTSGIIQCKRCQQWGHAATFCARTPKCLRCAESHLTSACGSNSDQHKCANCGGDHLANNQSCAVYKYKINKIIENTNKNNKTKRGYLPAPPPTKIAWQGGSPMSSSAPQINLANFPQLRTSRTSAQQQQPSAPPSPPSSPAVHYPGAQSAAASTSASGQVSDLFGIMGKLKNSNISEMVRFLKDFAKISDIQDKTAKCIALMQFAETFDNYNF